LTNEDLEVARDNFEMLRNNPDYRDETFYFLGRISELEADYLQATRAYSRVTEGSRAVESQARVGAIMYREMNDAEGALRHLREFGIANPRFSPEMLLTQAELLLDMDRLNDAFSLIDTAIEEAGDVADQSLQNAHVRFYATLMEQALAENDIEAAEAWMTEGLTRYPGNQNLRYSQARLLQEQGRLRRAVRMLRDLVDESPDDPVFLNALGYLLTDKMNRHTEARGYIQRALAMNPESGAILDSMGWVLFRLGEYELALDYLERAYRAYEDPEVMAHLIDVHWALGNEAMALEMLEEALSEAPENQHLTAVRGRLRP
jgi:tetratricopeptide (TPR) repeat protein